jgi:hypothetical protein
MSGKTAADFDLLKQIGEGAYGKVFKALDKVSKKIVAVKIIALESDWLPLLAEVNMVIDLQHPSIVCYYGWFFEEGRLWLIMEFCDGGSLTDIMRTLHRPLNEKELSAVMRGVLTSLKYVHSLNRIHRDIKSGNLLVTSDGLVKLCDFGVSAQLDDSLAKTGTRIGSPYWMAPEVILSQGHNTKADIWSVGITALELFSGHPPMHELPGMAAMMKVPSAPPPEAPANASDVFKAFIKAVLIKDPNVRPTAVDLLAHPFIATVGERAATEIVRALVASFVAAKASGQGPDEEEEEEEEEEDFDDGAGFGVPLPQAAATILFNDSTVIASGDGGGLSDWTPEFAAAPAPSPKMLAAQKRNFRNFKEPELRTMLTGVKNLAQAELKAGKISKAIIIKNYDEVRAGIIKELQRKHPEIADNYEALE